MVDSTCSNVLPNLIATNPNRTVVEHVIKSKKDKKITSISRILGYYSGSRHNFFLY